MIGRHRNVLTGSLVLRLLLVVLLGLVGAVVAEALRAHRLQGRVLAEALREYAGFAAWNFATATQAKLYVSSMARLAIGRGEGETDPRARLGTPADLVRAREQLAACRCSYDAPTRFHFRIERGLGGDGAMDTPTIAIAPGERASPALLRWIADTVLADASGDSLDPLIFRTLLVAPDEERAVAIVYYPAADRDGRVTAAVGFVSPVDRFLADVAAAVLDSIPLLPASLTRGTAPRELISLAIHAPDGRELFRSRPAYDGRFTAEARLSPPAFGGARVTLALNPARAPALIPGGTERSRLRFLLGALVVTGALIAVALWQVRREQQLVRLRADFTSSVSHELRTPLAQILLFGETLRSDRARSSDDRRLAVNVIVREARRLIHMVENVLHFARAERRIAYVEPEPVALPALVEETVQTFAPLAQASGVRWRTALRDGVIARVDRNALRQILLNLLDNAVKYGPQGQLVTVGLAAQDGRARLWVDDGGPGVPADRRAEIWHPFARLQREGGGAAAGSGGARTGAGLGLAVVRELVEMHDGRAWVEEAPGGGARFVVELPGVLDDEARSREGDEPGVAPAPGGRGAGLADVPPSRAGRGARHPV